MKYEVIERESGPDAVKFPKRLLLIAENTHDTLTLSALEGDLEATGRLSFTCNVEQVKGEEERGYPSFTDGGMPLG